jgi:hypothetical protein
MAQLVRRHLTTSGDRSMHSNPTPRVTLVSLGVGLAVFLASEFMHYRGQKRARTVAVFPITKHVNCRRPGAYK